jgi:hypothetical protein
MVTARLRRRSRIFLVIAALFACAGSVRLDAADAGAPSNEDLRRVRAIAEPQISPDGSRVLIRVTDATADGGRHHLWLVDVGANTTRQLTFSPTADKLGEHDARWLGDGGNILFLAKRTEHVQLYRLPMSGGEAHAYEIRNTSPLPMVMRSPSLRRIHRPPARRNRRTRRLMHSGSITRSTANGCIYWMRNRAS